MSKVLTLNKKEELENILSTNKYVVVDFSAEWCPPCKALAPLLDQLAATETDIKFLKVDVDAFNTIAQKYGISSIPTLIYFKEGQELSERTFGFLTKPKLMHQLDNLKK